MKLWRFSVAAFAVLITFAAYAVVVGNDEASQPGNDRGLNGTCKGAAIPSFPENGDANSINGWISGTSGQSYQAALVDPGDGTTILATSSVRTDISTPQEYEFTGGTLSGFDLTATTTYWPVICSTEASVALAYFVSGTETYDGLSAGSGISGIDPPVLNSAVTSDSGRDYAINIDYTAAAGGSIVPIIMQQLSANDDEFEPRLVANQR